MSTKCPMCRLEFKNTHAMNIHRAQSRECTLKPNPALDPAQCPQCQRIFKSTKGLHIHRTWRPNCKPPAKRITFEELDLDHNWANWFAGFVDGEGSFNISPCSNTKHKRFSIYLQISIRIDDEFVIKEILDRLKIGSIMLRTSPAIWQGCRMAQVRWKVSHLDDILNVIIPLFERYPLRSKKAKEFELWRRAAFIIREHRGEAKDLPEEVESLREQIMFIHRPYNHSALDPKTASLQTVPNLPL